MVVRVVLKERGFMLLQIVLVVLVIWVRVRVRVRVRAWALSVIRWIIWVKHGFVLMVVDHHAADDAVCFGSSCTDCVVVGHRLLLMGDNRTVCHGERDVKALRTGRKLWDRREEVWEEISRGFWTLLEPWRFLTLSRLIRINS